MLDAAIATKARDFALARVNGARGDQVLHIAPPDGAEANIELTFIASARRRRRHLLSARAGARRAQCAQLRIVERHLSAGSADSAINAAFDLALRADADHRPLPPAELRRCRELLRHADRARGRTRDLSPAHHHAGRARLALHDPRQARRPRRALRTHRRQHCQRHPDTRRVRRDRTRQRRHRDARVVSRHRHRPRQARLQRQDDRARIRARRGFRPVAENPAHRHRRGSVDPPAARDLHRQGARQAWRHHRQARRTDAVLPAVAGHRPAHRADTAAVGIHRRRDIAHGLPAAAHRNRTTGRGAAQRGVRARRFVRKS